MLDQVEVLVDIQLASKDGLVNTVEIHVERVLPLHPELSQYGTQLM